MYKMKMEQFMIHIILNISKATLKKFLRQLMRTVSMYGDILLGDVLTSFLAVQEKSTNDMDLSM